MEGRSRIALLAEVQEVTRQHLDVFYLDDGVDLEIQSDSDMVELCLNGVSSYCQTQRS